MPTYLGALFIGFPVWIILFIHRKDLRHKMLIMSIAVAFIAPVDTFFIPEYWNPQVWRSLFGLPIDIFTIIFGFTLGGIASVIYEELVGEKMKSRKIKTHPLTVFILAGGCLMVFIIRRFTDANFMWAVLAGTIVMILFIVISRRDLLKDVLMSGLFFAMIYSVLLALYIYIFPDVLTAWNFQEFPQPLVGNVPLFEIIWAFVTGAFLGPFYEYSHRLFLYKK